MSYARKAKNLLSFPKKMGKKAPPTGRAQLEAFEKDGTEREWQQVMMYAHVINETRDIPGDIVEFGVATGTSFKAFVRMNNILNNSVYKDIGKRNVYGFDSFEGLPELDRKIDLAPTDGQEKGNMRKGGFPSKSALPELKEFCEANPNSFLIEGWFNDSIPAFLEKHPHIGCSLIHIDCDIYESTKTALNAFIRRLNVGGIILFDEIFHRNFPGETEAFWEVYNQIKEEITLEFKRVESMPWKWYCVRTR